MTFESRHIRNKKSNSSFLIRILLMVVILLLLVVMMRQLAGLLVNETDTDNTEHHDPEITYWPDQYKELIRHSTFTLSYDEENEQAEWVAYVLTEETLNRRFVSRTDWFEADEKVSTGSAEFYDYKGSGYSKGHLIPSGDRAWNRKVNAETFYMSNISPQAYDFNGGIWRELEENVRDWAKEEGKLYIVTGPVFDKENPEIIGENRVTVPGSFFKVILDFEGPSKKAIGFLIPNQKSERPLDEYAYPVKKIEEITNFDFFNAVIADKELEDSLEATFNMDDWFIDPDRYRKRITVWNR